ncbi:MAG TPA: flagellar biosynthesis protein FliQ [Candidatus Cybelea sp.]|nr:flagellar biosynthesis protein FliQ [Candidatus Cybelea sp.]
MTPADVIDISRDAIWVLIKVAGPVMLIGLAVGLIVSLIQAVTQIQEMTLAFVPKILTIFVALLVFMPFMIATLTTFMDEIAQRIASLQ